MYDIPNEAKNPNPPAPRRNHDGTSGQHGAGGIRDSEATITGTVRPQAKRKSAVNETEFQKLLSDTKAVNSEDLRIQRWRRSIERIMELYHLDREKTTNLVLRRLEKDRKKKIPPDKSLEQLVKDVESDEYGQLMS